MYTINYKVTHYNCGTMRTTVATFMGREDAFAHANRMMANGMVDVKVYAL